MRKFFLLLIAVVLLGGVSANAQPVMKFEQSICDFGTFPEDAPQSFVFKFKNVGDETLVIHQVSTFCNCTVANFTKTPIEPGKAGEISVTYSGKGKLYGAFKKAITIRSNAKPTISRLTIMGNMTKPQAKQ